VEARLTLSAPEPLGPGHRTQPFQSGVPALDDWLKRRALANQTSGASRCFVTCDGDRVVGYCALASSAISVAAATGRLRRNMPDPVPVVVLARLAVDLAWQGRGIGRALFRDAAERILQAADVIGVRGILVHALSDEAAAFYRSLGFDPSPLGPMTLMVTLADVRAALRGLEK
jgi:predicted N-acetyltransferase YhbS